jgi:hypothetical protein
MAGAIEDAVLKRSRMRPSDSPDMPDTNSGAETRKKGTPS